MIFTPHPFHNKTPAPDQSATALEAAFSRLELERALCGLMGDALERLANGTYGNCARCSVSIAPARLRALPWVRMCADCQDAV